MIAAYLYFLYLDNWRERCGWFLLGRMWKPLRLRALQYGIRGPS